MSVVELPAAVTSLSIPHRLFQPITRDFPPPKYPTFPARESAVSTAFFRAWSRSAGRAWSLSLIHICQADPHGAAEDTALAEQERGVDKIRIGLDAGGRQGNTVGHEFPAAEQVDGPHILAGLPRPFLAAAILVLEAVKAEAAGFAIALLAVHRPVSYTHLYRLLSVIK